MKIRVAFYDENISWEKEWIFLGKSYLNLKSVEKKIKGKRIKIKKFLKESFNQELKYYLNWIEQQRVYSNDSVYWWMSTLADRNNANSSLFLYICQIIALKKILHSYNNEEILVVSDDILLIQTIIKNFGNHEIKKSRFLFLKFIRNTIHHYYKICRNFVLSCIDIFLNLFFAKITLKKKEMPYGKVYLLHQFGNIKSLSSDKKTNSRYFPSLKEYFNKENLNMYSLYWFGFFWSNKLKAFKKLRSEKSFIAEDWISLGDFFISIKNFFKTSNCFNNKVKYPKLNIDYLILREKKIYLEKIVTLLRFWIYFPALKKWSQKCEMLICIDHYENMIFEHALIAAAKNLNIKVKTCGYHHTLSSKEFTAWHSLNEEWKSNYKPDYVISLGPVSKKMLITQGTPSDRIIDGPALRYSDMIKKNFVHDKKNKKDIAVPLSQVGDASIEVLNAVKKLSDQLKNTDYRFIIKPHPNSNITKTLNLLGLNNLPSNIIISNKSLDSLLNECLFTIFLSTGAAYDAILNGNIVFNLSSELNIMENYLDIFEEDFSFVGSYTVDKIEEVLNQLSSDNSKINKYIDEFERLRLYLQDNMHIVTEEKLSNFKVN